MYKVELHSFAVWREGHCAMKPHLVDAVDEEHAAELWAEEIDADNDCPYVAVNNEEHEVLVSRADYSTPVKRVVVRGEMVPTYTAEEHKDA